MLESAYDGLSISVAAVYPEGRPEAVLQISHGLRGCKERYLPFMEYMSVHGVACVANDHRGHGLSVKNEKDRGYMYKGGYKALIDDMKAVTDWARRSFRDVPVFLLGHSMGSLAAGTYLKKYGGAIDGMILCGNPSWNPLLHAALALTRLLCLYDEGRYRPEMLQKMASAMYNRRFHDEGPEAWTCSDTLARKSFSSNPLCSFNLTANAAQALLIMMKERYSDNGWTVTNPEMPVYFISGEDDPCMRTERHFHKSAVHLASVGYTDVTSAIYPGMRHEVLNEIGKEAVWKDILDHINKWL